MGNEDDPDRELCFANGTNFSVESSAEEVDSFKWIDISIREAKFTWPEM